MVALRMLGLVILAGFAVSIGLWGYVLISSELDKSAARNAGSKVSNACKTVITIGGQQIVEITLPGNYYMRFPDNRIVVVVDDYCVFEEELTRQFAENAQLGPGGAYKLSITIDQNNELVVTRI